MLSYGVVGALTSKIGIAILLKEMLILGTLKLALLMLTLELLIN